jgi:hypothetical protein
MRRKKQDKLATEVLVMTKKLKVDYDENYDNCQEQEDDWVSSVIGTEDDAFSNLLANL